MGFYLIVPHQVTFFVFVTTNHIRWLLFYCRNTFGTCFMHFCSKTPFTPPLNLHFVVFSLLLFDCPCFIMSSLVYDGNIVFLFTPIFQECNQDVNQGLNLICMNCRFCCQVSGFVATKQHCQQFWHVGRLYESVSNASRCIWNLPFCVTSGVNLIGSILFNMWLCIKQWIKV